MYPRQTVCVVGSQNVQNRQSRERSPDDEDNIDDSNVQRGSEIPKPRQRHHGDDEAPNPCNEPKEYCDEQEGGSLMGNG